MDIRQIGQLSILPGSIEFPQIEPIGRIELIKSDLSIDQFKLISSIEIDDPLRNPDWCDQEDECWYPMCGCHVKPGSREKVNG